MGCKKQIIGYSRYISQIYNHLLRSKLEVAILYNTTIKSITENEVSTNDNGSQNMVTITFETENNGQSRLESITLVGKGTIKTTALV